MTVIDDWIAKQRRRLADQQSQLRELDEQVAQHELWLRIADPELVGEHAEEIELARRQQDALEEAHDELFRIRVGLDTLDSGTPDASLVERPAEDQRIAVLLPLRIETRFRFLHPNQPLEEPDSEPDDGSAEWRLLVRVEPDPLTLSTPPAEIVQAEADAVAAAWNRCGRSLAGDTGAEAFEVLSAQVGGAPRGAFLLREVPVVDDGSELVPAQGYPDERGGRPAALLGLPEILQIWVEDVTGRHLLEELRPDREAIVAQARPDAVVNPEEPSDPVPTWWTSFAAARDVGLAVEIRLGPERPRFAALYCLGAAVPDDGTVTPSQLFGNHAASGRLGTLSPLTATNTVAGGRTTDTGGDPAAWLEVARHAADDLGGLARALTGHRDLPGVPRPDRTLPGAASTLVAALWPALWQRSLKDVYDAGIGAFKAGDWAVRHLHPFGTHPVLRLGDLPYGVLPTSDFDQWEWRADDGPEGLSDPWVEERLIRVTSQALGPLTTTGEATGSAAGADAERLLDVLSKTPVTREYGSRSTGPTALVAAMLKALGASAMATPFGNPGRRFVERWDRQAWAIRTLLGGDVLRRYTPVGAVRPWPDPSGLAPDHREVLKRYFDSTWMELAENDDLSSRWRVEVRDPEGGDPRHLSPPILCRLVRHALVLTQAEVKRAFHPDPIANVLPVHDPMRLMRDAFGDDWEAQVPDLPDVVVDAVRSNPDPRLVAAVRQFEDVRDAVRALMDSETAPVLTALPAVLDTTSHRVDAWFEGLASRRLAEQTLAGVPHVLGAYGWVDGLEPNLDRTPPTRAGLLHAPGYSQALTAAVLRDHVVHQPDDPRWRIGLHSAQIRLAVHLGEQVRAGVHISEALGREIERRVGAPGEVDELRWQFPARPEWAGRRVCDGLQVLAATRPDNPDPDLVGQVPDWLVPDHGAKLEDLRQVVDTYGDLLLADAVHDVVDGRPQGAAEALEAAAGLGAPPEMRVLRTQREGGTVSTTVRVAVPWPEDPQSFAAGGSSPVGSVDPAVADLLESELGKAASWTWTRGAASTDLGSIGLRVADVLVAPPAALAASAERALAGPTDGGTAAAKLAQAGRLVAALGGSIVAENHHDELLRRLTRLRGLVDGLLARPNDLGESEALAWGLVTGDGFRDALRHRLAETNAAATDSASPAEELARRIRVLLPPALGLPLVCPEPLPGHQTTDALDDEWLPVVAAVRPSLAALEVAQLVANRRWRGARSDGLPVWAAPEMSRDGYPGRRDMTVHYGPAIGATAPGALAGVITVDAWAETVPSPRHTTWTSFGYDGPRARAPQAVLVVVPPVTTVPIDDEGLLGAVRHARTQARARAAPAASGADAVLGLPTAALLETGNAGCDLVRGG